MERAEFDALLKVFNEDPDLTHPPLQDVEAFWFALSTAAAMGANRIVSISRAGGKVVSMDACGHQGNIMSMFRPEFCDYSPVSEFYLIDGSSHSEETLAAVKEVFQGPLDFLFIDGDHTYEGALLDYQMYGPLVRSGGIIAVDDINMDVRVGRAWDEMVALGGERKMTSDAPKALGIIRLP